MTDARDRIDEASVSLAWSLWGELGASTWERRHQGWAIELEPLIAFTAWLAEHDRRLLREAVDWCAANAAFVSLSPEFESWGGFRGSVRADLGVSGRLAAMWPFSMKAGPCEIAEAGTML